MAQNAQASKATAQRLADQAGKVLVYVALGSGMAAFIVWRFFGGDGLLFALTAAIACASPQTGGPMQVQFHSAVRANGRGQSFDTS